VGKAAEAFRTISEVADELDVPKHVLRFWEQKFPQVRPMKRGGGRRYYRPEDLELLRGIRHLLHFEGYTIRGVQKILRVQGVDGVKRCWLAGRAPGQSVPPPGEAAPRARQRQSTRPVPGAASPASKEAVSPLAGDVRIALQAALAELEACRRLLAKSPLDAPERTVPRATRAGR
jgi:DNA-binding transcriptional MerR regulator